MNEPTNPMAESPDAPMRRWTEAARMASSETPSADMPGHSEPVTGNADKSNEGVE